jgi:hypothetical protein
MPGVVLRGGRLRPIAAIIKRQCASGIAQENAMPRLSLVMGVVIALSAWVGAALLLHPPRQPVVIQAGPPGGSFDMHARRYAAYMRQHGIDAEVRNQDDSLRIIDKIERGEGGARIGFTAQRVDRQAYPHVASAGVVELQPLFLFLRRALPDPGTLAGLAGRRLVALPQGSATAQAALDLLALYGVTPANASFQFAKIGDAAAGLQRGDYDAGFFMLAPDNALIRRLVADPTLRLLSFNDSVGISRNVDYLRATTLARGAYDLHTPLPATDIALVGAAVDVVVREDIPPAVLYVLLHAMNEVHKGQTLVSNPGDYPSQKGVVLPLHPLGAEWAKRGTPWFYTYLPPGIAGTLDTYLALALALVAVVSGLRTLGSLDAAIEDLRHGLALHALAWLQYRAKRGRSLGPVSRHVLRLAEPVVEKPNSSQVARMRLDWLRRYMGVAVR